MKLQLFGQMSQQLVTPVLVFEHVGEYCRDGGQAHGEHVTRYMWPMVATDGGTHQPHARIGVEDVQEHGHPLVAISFDEWTTCEMVEEYEYLELVDELVLEEIEDDVCMGVHGVMHGMAPSDDLNVGAGRGQILVECIALSVDDDDHVEHRYLLIVDGVVVIVRIDCRYK